MNEDYLNRFSGIKRLYGIKAFERIQSAHIAIIGLGGTGSWSAEALARTGVMKITLMDLDDICISNTNRQVHAHDGNTGKLKTHALKERILSINPHCQVNCIDDFYGESTSHLIFDEQIDCIIDAIDSIKAKCHLISECSQRSQTLIVTGGAGGKIDPTLIEVCDLAKSINDKLLGRVRKMLTQEYNFTKGRKKKFNIPCVFSKEFARYPGADGEICDAPLEGTQKLDCESGFGSATFVTGTFGFIAASTAINIIINKDDN